MIQQLLVISSALVLHELGHIIKAKQIHKYRGLTVTYMGIGTQLAKSITPIESVKVMCLGVICGYVPFILINNPIDLMIPFIFYFGCCIPDYYYIMCDCLKIRKDLNI